MAKFRFAVALGPYAERERPFRRPPLPDWINPDRYTKFKKGTPRAVSGTYWNKIYWGTPPWLNDEQTEEMKRIHDECPPGHHVDHIVPLAGGIVCGLHVPWNLQHLPEKANYHKSNNYWPDMPYEQLELELW